MRVAVTGGTGHLGVNLVRSLVERGDEVRVLVRPGAAEGPVSAKSTSGASVIPGDVADPASLVRCFEGAEVVYHLAALISITGDQGGRVTATNVDGARNVAIAALGCGVRRFAHVASVHAFDMHPLDQPVDESRARALGAKHAAYDRSKALGERAVREVFAKGLDGVVLHPSGIIGPSDPRPSRMGQLFLDLQHRRLPALTPGGFDWVDVRDVVRGVLLAAERGSSAESYILSGSWHSIHDLAGLAQAVTGVSAPRFTSPMWAARLGAPFMTAFNRVTGIEPLYTSEALDALEANRILSHEKAASHFGYTARPIGETIRDLYAWFEGEGRLK